jgi:mRNA interferase MazF
MRRGDVYLVDLDPVQGAEANKQRPAVLVSNSAANRSAERHGRGVVTVVPVTSNTGRVHPFQTLISAGTAGLAVESKAQAEQIRSIDVSRLGRRLGGLPVGAMRALDGAIRLHLGL